MNRYLKELAKKEVLFPDGTRKKPSHSTLKRKLRAYGEGGLEALARKPRKDRGTCRVVPPDVIATAVEAKKEQPRRSDETLNRILDDQHGVTLKRSTLYRHLKQAGATRLKLGVVKKPVRKRWTRDHTHDLWLGDFENGPYVLVGDQVLPTYLCAWVDCHSRYAVEARYYLRQNLDILIDSWIRALTTHGASLELYVDNAKVFHARGLQRACYHLFVRLLHRRPKDPPGGGLIERFIETVQSQFEAEIRAGALLPLDQLNRAFSAWLQVSYHQRPNEDTGQPPKQRYEEGLTVIRHVDMNEVLACFMQPVTRTVNPEFSDVQLHNQFYRVDPRLRGDKIEVRYDPFSNRDTVLLYSLQEEYLGQGVRHQRETAPTPPRPEASGTPPSEPEALKYDYVGLLLRKHDEQLEAATKGIDYQKLAEHRGWPFNAFVTAFARLLGRKGGAAAFTAGELEILKKTHSRCRGLRDVMLTEAFENAPQKSIPYVTHELQKLAKEQERT